MSRSCRLAQVKQTIMSLVSTAKVMVFSIALIAILIAMVGVINTILMSVFERFQEIGILKSIGAMPWDIFRLIWTETVILCCSAGWWAPHGVRAGPGHRPVIRTSCPTRRPAAWSGSTPADAATLSCYRPGQRHLSGLAGGAGAPAGIDPQRGE